MSASRIARTIAAIDEVDQADQSLETVGDRTLPAALVYSQRMTATLERLYPNPTAALRIAIKAQHIQRWAIPRASYSMDRSGYLRWRSELKTHHANLTGAILADCGFEEPFIARVKTLVRKERLKQDSEAQALEDVACIVFLEHYLEAFAAKHSEDKLTRILRKTWTKMSEHGRTQALRLPLSDDLAKFLRSALVQ